MIFNKFERNINNLTVNFMKNCSGVISFRHESLQIRKQIFPQNLHRCTRIRLCDSIEIPPDTGYIQRKLGTDYGLVEPKQIINVNGLLMGKTLVYTKNDEISI